MSKPVQPIRPAATVIVIREASSSYEIFMLKRTSKASFASDMYVFPGGRVDGDDHLHKYDAYRHGPTEAQAPQVKALGMNGAGFGSRPFAKPSKRLVYCWPTISMAR